MFLYIIIKNTRKNTSAILALISGKHNDKINIIDNGKFEDWRLKMKANLEKKRTYEKISLFIAMSLVGFGDIDKTGYLDRLFVHADYQRKGIATAICNQLEQAVQGNITTDASITAKPFFEKRDYKIVKEQQVERQGIFLTNYVMIKEQ